MTHVASVWLDRATCSRATTRGAQRPRARNRARAALTFSPLPCFSHRLPLLPFLCFRHPPFTIVTLLRCTSLLSSSPLQLFTITASVLSSPSPLPTANTTELLSPFPLHRRDPDAITLLSGSSTNRIPSTAFLLSPRTTPPPCASLHRPSSLPLSLLLPSGRRTPSTADASPPRPLLPSLRRRTSPAPPLPPPPRPPLRLPSTPVPISLFLAVVACLCFSIFYLRRNRYTTSLSSLLFLRFHHQPSIIASPPPFSPRRPAPDDLRPFPLLPLCAFLLPIAEHHRLDADLPPAFPTVVSSPPLPTTVGRLPLLPLRCTPISATTIVTTPASPLPSPGVVAIFQPRRSPASSLVATAAAVLNHRSPSSPLQPPSSAAAVADLPVGRGNFSPDLY